MTFVIIGNKFGTNFDRVNPKPKQSIFYIKQEKDTRGSALLTSTASFVQIG